MAFVLFEQSSMMWALYDVSRTGSRQSEVPNHGTGIVSCSCQTYSCHYEKRCPSEIYYRISFDLIHDNVDHECLCLQDKANFVTSVQTRMTSKTYVDELFVFRYARVQDAVTVSSPNISVQRLVEVEGVCVLHSTLPLYPLESSSPSVHNFLWRLEAGTKRAAKVDRWRLFRSICLKLPPATLTPQNIVRK